MWSSGVEVFFAVAAPVCAVIAVIWHASNRFTRVETRLTTLDAGVSKLDVSVNARFDKNDAAHVVIFDRLGCHGEAIAVLEDRLRDSGRSKAGDDDVE